jgi:hypothetical protein
MLRAATLSAALLLLSPGVFAQAGQACVFDVEKGEVADCVRPGTDGGLWINPEYVRQLEFRDGLAALHVDSSWMYVDRSGHVVVSGVPSFDNGPDEFHNGLVRFVKDGKYGFANRKGKVIVRAIYDGALNFKNGIAEVCLGCVATHDAEHGYFTAGEWFVVDKKGRESRRAPKQAGG